MQLSRNIPKELRQQITSVRSGQQQSCFRKLTAQDLELTNDLKELRYAHFKGVAPKILKVNGKLYEQVDKFLTASAMNDGTLCADAITETLKAFRDTTSPQIDSRKPRIFQSGVKLFKTRLALNQFILPVPHVKGVCLILTTIEVASIRDINRPTRTSMWSLYYDDDLPDEVKDHFSTTIKLDYNPEDYSYSEAMTKLIFEVTPYRQPQAA